MAIDTGGPAFPAESIGLKSTAFGEAQHLPAYVPSSQGMTHLDVAALAALQVVGPYLAQYAPDKAAKIAYDMAEAMVAEKRKRENV